jgi:hypothetical protein
MSPIASTVIKPLLKIGDKGFVNQERKKINRSVAASAAAKAGPPSPKDVQFARQRFGLYKGGKRRTLKKRK